MGEGALKFFLDCGAHNGGSVTFFRRTFLDWREFEVHCFEPNPMLCDRLREFDGVTVHQVAVWIEDEERPFYLRRDGKMKASSLIAVKEGLDLDSPLLVECIDFGSWVKAKCLPGDHVVIKMDIEGAEYRVLPRMVEDGSIDLVDELYVEFHGHKTGITPDVHDALVSSLRARGLEPKIWRQ